MLVAFPAPCQLEPLYGRFGFQRFVLLGTSVTALAAFGLAYSIANQLPIAAMYATTFAFGLGMGLTNTAILLAVQTGVAWERRGVATASTMFFRAIGGVLVVGFLGGHLAQTLRDDSDVSAKVINDLLGPQHGADLDPALLGQLKHVLAAALTPIFWTVAGITVLFFVFGLLFPKHALAETKPRQGV